MSESKLLDVFGLMLMLISMTELFAVVRIFKRSVLKSILVMTSVSLRSGKVFLLFCGIVALFCAVFENLLSAWIPPFPRILMMGLGLVALGGACLPPGIVYLAASQATAFSFAHQLMFAVAPIKVSHLLNSFEAGAILGDQIHMSEYRVAERWEEAVRRLCDIAPLILFDSRMVTLPVLQEVQYILESGKRCQTIFITEENGAIPALHSFDDGFVFTLTPKAAITSFRGLGWKILFRGRKALDQLVGDEVLLQ